MAARTFSLTLLLALFLTPFSVAQNQHAFLWTPTGGMQDLGVPSGYASSAAVAINNRGRVAGALTKADGITSTAAIWTVANGWRILPSSESAFATAINDAGQVVGEYNTSPQQAILWAPGKSPQELGTLGGTNSVAISLINAGQVVGVSSLPGDLVSHAFSWSASGGMQDLGTFSSFPNGMSWATSINNTGEIVGWATKANHQVGTAVWNGGQLRELPITLGKSDLAYAVSDAGQIVGTFALTKTETHGFSWTRTTGAIDLGLQPDSTGTTPLQVNSVGQIVGFSIFSTGYRAFLWTPTGGFQDLGTLGGATSLALGINRSGQVVGASDVP
jgi:probable HAF family extracellular repeat protein